MIIKGMEIATPTCTACRPNTRPLGLPVVAHAYIAQQRATAPPPIVAARAPAVVERFQNQAPVKDVIEPRIKDDGKGGSFPGFLGDYEGAG
ncbi:glycine/sarcosine/betaine reductase component B subunit, partial [Eubacteriales bacterium DFI.9.88]|nr:glycine/sarcosine/betaine reductase component B subunit [Eubacteriales bacterium DFI.9.88]